MPLPSGARASVRPLPECRALVIGGGSVGLLGGLILQAWGARQVGWPRPIRCAAPPPSAPASTPSTRSRHRPSRASFDLVLDAVGSTATRAAAIAATRPGGVISHVGLQEWAGEFDARRLTLAEITFVGVYVYTDADLRASLAALHDGRLGSLEWIERRPLAEGAQAFLDLDAGATPAAKIILSPR